MDWLNFERRTKSTAAAAANNNKRCCFFFFFKPCPLFHVVSVVVVVVPELSVIEAVPSFYDNGYFSLITSWFYELEGGNDMAPLSLLMSTLDIIISPFKNIEEKKIEERQRVIIYKSSASVTHHRARLPSGGRESKRDRFLFIPSYATDMLSGRAEGRWLRGDMRLSGVVKLR